MTIERVIILGALSAIGEATARRHAAKGCRLVLVGRHDQRLAAVAADLKARGAASCEFVTLDLAAVEDIASRLAEMVIRIGGSVDVVYLFYGILGDQKAAERDAAAVRRIIQVNFASAAEWCLAAANQLESQNAGVLVAISSVAGDRGRQSNYVYGAAKAGLATLVEGISHRLAAGHARAVVVKLGFVDTPMTAHIEKKSGPLWVKPDYIAAKLVAIAGKPSAPVVYLPWFWRVIMLAVRATPAALFHKTRL